MLCWPTCSILYSSVFHYNVALKLNQTLAIDLLIQDATQMSYKAHYSSHTVTRLMLFLNITALLPVLCILTKNVCSALLSSCHLSRFFSVNLFSLHYYSVSSISQNFSAALNDIQCRWSLWKLFRCGSKNERINILQIVLSVQVTAIILEQFQK